MDGGAWYAAVHRVAKNQTQLSDFTYIILSSNSTLRYRKNENVSTQLVNRLFVTAGNQNKSNTHQKINKMWHIQTTEYYSAVKKKLGTDTCHDVDKLQVKEARQEKPHTV